MQQEFVFFTLWQFKTCNFPVFDIIYFIQVLQVYGLELKVKSKDNYLWSKLQKIHSLVNVCQLYSRLSRYMCAAALTFTLASWNEAVKLISGSMLTCNKICKICFFTTLYWRAKKIFEWFNIHQRNNRVWEKTTGT